MKLFPYGHATHPAMGLAAALLTRWHSVATWRYQPIFIATNVNFLIPLPLAQIADHRARRTSLHHRQVAPWASRHCVNNVENISVEQAMAD
jgi:hypothetical protein